MLGWVFRSSAVFHGCSVLGMKHYGRLGRLAMPLVGPGGGSEENMGATFGQNLRIHTFFLHDLSPQGLPQVFHISGLLEQYLPLLALRGAPCLVPAAGSEIPPSRGCMCELQATDESQLSSAVDIQASTSQQTEGTWAGLHSNTSVVQFGASAGAWVVLA